MGGGSFAITALGKNSVKSKQIKDGAVKTRDIANGAVNEAKLAPGTVTPQAIEPGSIGSAQIADNSITGADIDESTLQGVNAATAASAANADKVGGLEVKQVSFEVPVGTPIQSVLTYPGIFRIDAQCASTGDGLDVSAATAVNGSLISRVSIRSEDGSNDGDAAVDFLTEQDSPFDINEVSPSTTVSRASTRTSR